MEKFEIIKNYENFKTRIDDLVKVIDINRLNDQIAILDAKMLEENFWQDTKSASVIIKNANKLKDDLSKIKHLQELLDELELSIELDEETSDIEILIKTIEDELDKFEISQLLDGEYDNSNAIMELHPGAGGTESQDWALMLYRMYKRFSERFGFEFELIDYQEANDAGLKSVTFMLKGTNAFGYMAGEKGVHRLVRISPFDSNSRRHTSFVACNVTPEINNTIEIEVLDEDIRVDTYRSSGAGGQHVNTTDSAIRITHLPTGIVVCCQNERSQIQNRERAMQILKSKLYQRKQEENEKNLKNITGDLSDNAFGSQIRSYVLHPYSMIKDHRTNVEAYNTTAVLDGDIELFINEYLKYKKANM